MICTCLQPLARHVPLSPCARSLASCEVDQRAQEALAVAATVAWNASASTWSAGDWRLHWDSDFCVQCSSWQFQQKAVRKPANEQAQLHAQSATQKACAVSKVEIKKWWCAFYVHTTLAVYLTMVHYRDVVNVLYLLGTHCSTLIMMINREILVMQTDHQQQCHCQENHCSNAYLTILWWYTPGTATVYWTVTRKRSQQAPFQLHFTGNHWTTTIQLSHDLQENNFAAYVWCVHTNMSTPGFFRFSKNCITTTESQKEEWVWVGLQKNWQLHTQGRLDAAACMLQPHCGVLNSE